jgi:hypothetical protein
LWSLKESYIDLNKPDNAKYKNDVQLVPRPRFNIKNEELYLSDEIHGSTPILPGELNNVKFLHMGNFTNGNQPLEPGVLPNSLRELYMNNFTNRNQPLVSGVLPNSLRELYMNNFTNGNQPLVSGVLPNSLRVLIISNRNHHIISGDNVVPRHTVIDYD